MSRLVAARWRRIAVIVFVLALIGGIAGWAILRSRPSLGLCENTNASLLLHANGADLAGAMTAEEAQSAARTALAAQYPDLADADAVPLSPPQLVRADLPGGEQSPAYQITARLKSALPDDETTAAPTDQRLGMTTILYLDPVNGNVLYMVTALNARSPQSVCF
ncbi:MAG: hypothetical protein U0670_11155 [Anaerolineae bacterium]